MRVPPPYHNAYVLWLIRQRTATTRSELCAHFKIDPNRDFTRMAMLHMALQELQEARLIEADGEIADAIDPTVDADASFSVTPLCQHVLHALRLSLADLAGSDPDQRLLVTPVPRRTFATKYQSDILVFMPFADDLAPVYEDHLKEVARRLGKSIARADDFFTSEQVVDEIWTALVSTRLVVADCSRRNPNVFYEIGLAHAVGKPTVLITQDTDDIPFDLRHRRFLRYELTPRGMKKFEESLEKTIATVLADESPG